MYITKLLSFLFALLHTHNSKLVHKFSASAIDNSKRHELNTKTKQSHSRTWRHYTIVKGEAIKLENLILKPQEQKEIYVLVFGVLCIISQLLSSLDNLLPVKIFFICMFRLQKMIRHKNVYDERGVLRENFQFNLRHLCVRSTFLCEVFVFTSVKFDEEKFCGK